MLDCLLAAGDQGALVTELCAEALENSADVWVVLDDQDVDSFEGGIGRCFFVHIAPCNSRATNCPPRPRWICHRCHTEIHIGVKQHAAKLPRARDRNSTQALN